MATIKFAKSIHSILALSALTLAAVHAPAAALAAWLEDALPSEAAEARAFQKAFIGFELPPALCGLVEGMYAKERSAGYPGQSAATFPGLIEESVPMGTGMGYDLGPIRIQGIGVYDPQEDYASLGPAFRLNIDNGFEITTGMQLPVTENGPGDSPDLYYAEFTILF